MKRSDFDNYFKLFNARKYDEFIQYYADDLVYVMDAANDKIFYGTKELTDMYKELHQYLEEEVSIEHIAITDTFISVSVPTTLTCIKDFDVDGFAFKSKKGDVCHMVAFIFYDLNAEGKINKIRVAIQSMEIIPAK